MKFPNPFPNGLAGDRQLLDLLDAAIASFIIFYPRLPYAQLGAERVNRRIPMNPRLGSFCLPTLASGGWTSCPILRSGRGPASRTARVRVGWWNTCPLRALMAAHAWALKGISTKANPLERRVAWSRMMATESTWPWILNMSFTSPSLNSRWRFPTYILKNSSFGPPLYEFPSEGRLRYLIEWFGQVVNFSESTAGNLPLVGSLGFASRAFDLTTRTNPRIFPGIPIEVTGNVSMCSPARTPMSKESRATASLSSASTIIAMSYLPNTAYKWRNYSCRMDGDPRAGGDCRWVDGRVTNWQ